MATSYTRIYRAFSRFPADRWVEPGVKRLRLGTTHAESSEVTGEFIMKKITAAIALMCALSAYVSYPSAGAGGADSSLARSMQESSSVEASDAV